MSDRLILTAGSPDVRRSLFQPRVRLLANVMVYTLADFVADLGQVPAGVNGYAYAASRARLFVQPPPSLAVARTFLALGVVHALVALASIVLLVVRIRRGGFWLARREASPVGVFLLLNVLNVALVATATFSVLAQGSLWSLYALARTDSVAAAPAATAWIAVVWLPLVALILADLSTLGVRFVRRLHIQSNRLPIATIYTALNVLVPFALGSAIVATSIVLVVVYVRPTTDGVTLIQERLLALAPTYTGQIDLAQLVPLLSPANELAGLVAPLQRLFKVVFSLYAGWVIAIYLMWLPLSIAHIVELRRQMRMLSNTRHHLSTPQRNGASMQDQDRAERVVVDRKSAQDSPSWPPRTVDRAERRMTYLWRACMFRIVIVCCASIALTAFVALTLVVAVDPTEATVGAVRTAYSTISGFVASLVIELPICVAAAHRPLPTDDAQPPRHQPIKIAPEMVTTPSLAVRIEIETCTSRSEP